MSEKIDCDVCVIGAGAGGLTVAGGAAQFGVRTVLFERGKMGGDCLNYGCVPSKALLAAAHRAQAARESGRYGIRTGPMEIDFAGVMKHVRDAIAAIAPHDSEERFRGFGVRIIRADAKLTGPNEVTGGGYLVRAKRIVIAAGSRAAIPPIEGLHEVPYLTNETIFALNEQPSHLLIVGGGPIGVEMAQGFRRLGSAVTLFDAGTILSKDDTEARAILREQLVAEDVALRENVSIGRIAREGEGIAATLRGSGEKISGSHVLVAAGRSPSVEGLGLEAARVDYDAKGIKTDAHLRTSNKRIYAIGDIAQGPQFTHVAGLHGRIVLKNALFRMRAKVNYDPLPHVTYTDPELAQIGLQETEARNRYGDIRIVRSNFAENDRAVADGKTGGFIKVVMLGNGRLIGVTLVGANAGELIHAWALALSRKMKLNAFDGIMLPYPTLGEISQAASDAHYFPKIFGLWPKRIAKFLLALG